MTRSADVKLEAVRLRTEQRLSLKAISAKLGVSKSSLSGWLREHPLSSDEVRDRLVQSGTSSLGRRLAPKSLPNRALAGLFEKDHDSKHLRDAAVGYAVAWFLDRGYTPSIPVAQVIYDLVVDSDAGLKRVQVKTTCQETRYGRWSASICHRRGNKQIRAAYTRDEIDLLFVMTGDHQVYLIPVEAVEGKLNIVLDRAYAQYRVESRSVAQSV